MPAPSHGGLRPVGVGEVVRLAIPSAAFTVLTHGYRLVDQYFIQTVSTEAQAAVGASVFVSILFYAAFEVLSQGAAPLIARATGAGDPDLRRSILGSALAGALCVTVLLMLAGVVGATWIAGSLGLGGETRTQCALYIEALSWSILPLVLTPLVDQAFVAMGNARTPLVLHALSLGLNIVLTPLLIHTAGLGIVGAALASNIARAVATGIGLVGIARETGLSVGDLSFVRLSRIAKIGLPVALGTAFYSLVYWLMLRTSISPLGPHVNAALGIGFSALEGFTWPLFHGVSLAIASIVGRQLGAKNADGAWAALKLGFPIATTLGAMAALAFWLLGKELTGLFTTDPRVHAAATEYAVILAASQLFVAWEAFEEGVLAGAGDTRPIFFWSVPFNLLRVPLAWYFAFPLGMGAAGVWWAINVTTYAKTLGKGYSTLRGKWANLEI